MKYLLLTTAVLLTGPAMAADLYTKAAPTPQPAPFIASPWDGLYVGGNVGYAWGSFDTDARNGNTSTFSQNGLIGGVQAGAQKQFGQIVVGIESDFQLTGITASSIPGGGTQSAPWFGTARVKAGVLIAPQWLIYGTGGAAYDEVKDNLTNQNSNLFGFGWAAGGGVEYMISPNWIAGLEYLHLDIADPTMTTARASFPTIGGLTNADVIRGTLSFKF